jgi:hypothetical protein
MTKLIWEDFTHIEKQKQEERDNFAIDFHQWMRVNDTKENAEKYFHYTDKDMLNAFKEEKGL